MPRLKELKASDLWPRGFLSDLRARCAPCSVKKDSWRAGLKSPSTCTKTLRPRLLPVSSNPIAKLGGDRRLDPATGRCRESQASSASELLFRRRNWQQTKITRKILTAIKK